MVSPTLGIPWNNEMDDFSTPGLTNYFGYAPSIANYIAPGKRPMSSMSPTIIHDEKNGVKLAVGGSGGTYIISSVAQTTIRALIFNQTIKVGLFNRGRDRRYSRGRSTGLGSTTSSKKRPNTRREFL